MPSAAELFARYRLAAVAIAASAAVHAMVFVGVPPRIEAFDEGPAATYSASLDPAALVADSAAPAARPAPKRVAKARAKPRPAAPPPPEPAPPEIVAAAPPPVVPPPPETAPVEEPKPEVVAMAQPATPVPALEPPKFPVEALPGRLSITYALTSAFAEGRAVYNWSRDGDTYTITGEAEAVGFFTLFLEGRILQESKGTVTTEGLRPERFVERKPNTANEGIEFDWPNRKVTLDYKGEKKAEDLTENALDWLSMIFQMAHAPPTGESYDLSVFTQRKYYKFHLEVIGLEEIEIPLGKVKTLHLRHTDPKDQEVVDVWLGIDQHYLPVKLRYPVARNRLTVEQSATRVSVR
jgi:uncharacterized protein DUF3108